MSDTNNTLKKKENQYHHLTEKDRATIQALIEQKDGMVNVYLIILI